MAKSGGKEAEYKKQLQELGIYEPAFDAAIKELAQLEREKSRVQKAWKATAAKDKSPSVLDPHYAIIVQIRRDIMAMRDVLGLTPKALRRLRNRGGSGAAGPAGSNGSISNRLDAILDQVSGYE